MVYSSIQFFFVIFWLPLTFYLFLHLFLLLYFFAFIFCSFHCINYHLQFLSVWDIDNKIKRKSFVVNYKTVVEKLIWLKSLTNTIVKRRPNTFYKDMIKNNNFRLILKKSDTKNNFKQKMRIQFVNFRQFFLFLK